MVAFALLANPLFGRARKHHEAARTSADDGLAIITAALDFPRAHGGKPDCSHLVHTIYSDAGLSYRYADSRDLYYGVSGFQRVSKPEPGDLIVWRSHSGIVVDPEQHSFYSSLNSGLGIDYYDSRYWKHKGKPHFYRFSRDGNQHSALSIQPSEDDQ